MYGATIGKLGILKIETSVNQACCVLANPAGINYKLVFYFLLSIRNEIINLSFGGGQPNISQEIVRSIKIPVAPSKEQNLIVSFLDKKVIGIDQTISNKQRLIDLLEEEKKVLINEAVTKGLNPKAKLKSSGIDWLGKIPAHWDVKRLKYVTTEIQTGKTPPTAIEEYFQNQDHDWFTPGDFKDELELTDSIRKISKAAVENEKLKLYKPNAVLLVAIGATLGKVGIVNSYCFSNQQINAITFDENVLLPHFGCHFLDTFSPITLMQSVSATLPILNQEKTKDLLITVPPIKEQKSIIEYINTHAAEINGKINLIKQEIELLTEYKQALIFEAVTGKIDLTNN
jgi:type I restriction enzyme S subunit